MARWQKMAKKCVFARHSSPQNAERPECPPAANARQTCRPSQGKCNTPSFIPKNYVVKEAYEEQKNAYMVGEH